MSFRHTLLPPLAAAASGALLSLCFPGFGLGGLVWVWMAPLLLALWFPRPGVGGRRRALRGFGLGYLAGLAFFVINLSWLYHNHEIHFAASFALQAYLALYFGLWGAFAATAGRPRFVDEPVDPASRDPWEYAIRPALQSVAAAAANAGAWCGLEWLRGWLLSGFGWNGLGVALHEDLVMVQVADLVGVIGVAFMPAFCACVAAGVLLRLTRELRGGRLRAHLDFAAAVLLVVGAFYYGTGKLSERPEETVDVRILLVQGGVPQDDKWDAAAAREIYDRYWRMTTRYLEHAEFDLVVWPESSLPYSLHDPYNAGYLDRLLAVGDFELLLGLNEEVPGEGIFNSIVALRGEAASARSYRKIHLVPFGEFVPFREQLPFLEDLVPSALGVDFQPGTSAEPLSMAKPEPYGVIPLVCFEDTVGRLARRFVRPGPQLIVNVTNDAWFGHSAASEQHLANALFRCIELRRPMARCANTGVTCLIDSAGSLYDRWVSPPGGVRKVLDPDSGSTFIEAALPESVSIPGGPPTTFYARFGDVFTLAATALALGIAVVRCRAPRSPRG